MLEQIHSPDDIKRLSFEELEQLAGEIRARITDVVSRNGGHFASNLGVVEATLAIHWVFNSPRDRIIWDVGHQSYTHKLLTGRNDVFDTLRRFGGISGFPKRAESPHDVFETGHSTTSLSAALGMARARDLAGEHHDVVAFIGDGSMTGGMAFEAMNDAGHSGTRMIVVLNDNEMSISRSVGALSEALARVRTKRQYRRTKNFVQRTLRRVPLVGGGLAAYTERVKNSIKYLLVRGVFFEELGFAYLGPVDGHDIPALVASLKRARQFDRPVVVHISTRKGMGHTAAERNPEHFHSMPEGCDTAGGVKYAHIVGSTLSELAESRREIVAITASMCEGCGLENFRRLYPDRFFDVGIAEQHAVTMAAGMAVDGLRPVFAVYSSFLQRSYDQILHDVCRQNLNVVFAVSHCGLVGEDGETHQGVFTLSYLGNIPNLRIFYPANGGELRAMLRLALELDGPTAICYPKGATQSNTAPGEDLAAMRWNYLLERDSADAAILTVGERMTELALAAAAKAEGLGVKADVINCRFLKPLDADFLKRRLPGYRTVLTLEENVLSGGFGSMVLSALAARGALNGTHLLSMGIRDEYVPHGTVAELLELEGLTADAVAGRLVEAAKR